MNHISWWDTHIGNEEIELVTKSIENRNIGMGSVTKTFENNISKLLNVEYVVATPSGSTALYMSLMILGVGVGDEVIIPDRTFIATAHAVKLTGAKVITVDCNELDTNINISKIEEKITPNTKVIIPVHLNGRCVDMKAINNIASKYKLKVIEDACQSLFSKNTNDKFVGTLSDLGCFSLGLAKIITVGFGGFIVTHDRDLYDKLLKFRNHGRLNHEHINYDVLGFNFKVSDVTMSIGIAQLSKRHVKIEHVKKIYNLYKNCIDKLDYIDLIPVNIKYEIPLYIEVVSKYRDKIIKYLKDKDIEINFLPPSIHLSQHLKQEDDSYTNSLFFNNNSFMLPCGSNQSIANINRVITQLKDFRHD